MWNEYENDYEREQELLYLEYQLETLKRIQERNSNTSLENFVNDMIEYHKQQLEYDDFEMLFGNDIDINELYNSTENLLLIDLLKQIKR